MYKRQVYCIANLEIEDAELFRNYEKGFFGTLKEYNGEFMTMDDESIHLEGTSPIEGRVIMWTFPSEEEMNSWFSSTSYQELAENYRRPATELKNLTVIKAMPTR